MGMITVKWEHAECNDVRGVSHCLRSNVEHDVVVRAKSLARVFINMPHDLEISE